MCYIVHRANIGLPVDFLAPDPATAVLVTLSACFAFQASLATAIFLKTLPWKRFFICYLVAAILVPFLGVGPGVHEAPWSEILGGWTFLSIRIFVGCLIGTAPVALVLLGVKLYCKNRSPSTDV